MAKPTERIAFLEAELQKATQEIRHSHALLAILLSQRGGSAVVTDHEMQNAGAVGVLTVLRDERIPGAVLMVKASAA